MLQHILHIIIYLDFSSTIYNVLHRICIILISTISLVRHNISYLLHTFMIYIIKE